MAEDNNILDFYPDGEEDSCAEDSYVTLVDDEGNEVEMSVVDIVEHKGENYVILLPVENIESGDMQFAVMKIEYDEETDEYTYVTGNEPEYDEVFIEFRERLEQELSIIDDAVGEIMLNYRVPAPLFEHQRMLCLHAVRSVRGGEIIRKKGYIFF